MHKLENKSQLSWKEIRTKECEVSQPKLSTTHLSTNKHFHAAATELKAVATVISNQKSSPNLQKFYPQIRTLFPMLKVVRGDFKCDSEFCLFLSWESMKPYKTLDISFIVSNPLLAMTKNRFFSPYFNKSILEKNDSLFKFVHKYANDTTSGYVEESPPKNTTDAKHKRICIFCINIIANIVSKYEITVPA